MAAIDIITPTYRRQAGLPEYFAMLAAQQFRDFRVILINDEPTEDLRPLVADWAAQLDILLLQPGINQRVAAARNLGLAQASAPIVALCDDDDRWLPWHLQQTHDALVSSGADLVCAAADVVQVARGEPQAVARRPFAFLPDGEFLARWNTMPPSCLVYRRALHQQLGGFDETLPHYADWDWALRVCRAGAAMKLSMPVSVEIRFDLAGDNQSADPNSMAPELALLIAKHQLGPLPSSNFWRMLDEPDVARRRVLP